MQDKLWVYFQEDFIRSAAKAINISFYKVTLFVPYLKNRKWTSNAAIEDPACYFAFQITSSNKVYTYFSKCTTR